ncbi:hypothetical protein BC940DRAFT_322568 [Gongronella butleri]|nr:hypothetical protein BC940DRAFT_322568 [Gongronella butleri]
MSSSLSQSVVSSAPTSVVDTPSATSSADLGSSPSALASNSMDSLSTLSLSDRVVPLPLPSSSLAPLVGAIEDTVMTEASHQGIEGNSAAAGPISSSTWDFPMDGDVVLPPSSIEDTRRAAKSQRERALACFTYAATQRTSAVRNGDQEEVARCERAIAKWRAEIKFQDEVLETLGGDESNNNLFP